MNIKFKKTFHSISQIKFPRFSQNFKLTTRCLLALYHIFKRIGYTHTHTETQT